MSFSTRDRFVKVAAMLCNGTSLNEIGKPYQIKESMEFKPSYDSSSIHGLVYYIDAYENLVTNIPYTLFEQIRAGRKFTIKFSGKYRINKIHKSYQDVPVSEMLALFGTHGFLEIAINYDKAASLLGMHHDSSVDIYFEDGKDVPADTNLLF